MLRSSVALFAFLLLAACSDNEQALGPLSLAAVKVGMTPDEAAKALGAPLTPRGAKEEAACWYTHRADQEARRHVDYMVVDGKIARIDVYAPEIKTAENVGVGASLDEVQTAYGGTQLTVWAHKYADAPQSYYVKWTYYDKSHGIVFDVVAGKVTSVRSGHIPEIEWVEGCL